VGDVGVRGISEIPLLPLLISAIKQFITLPMTLALMTGDSQKQNGVEIEKRKKDPFLEAVDTSHRNEAGPFLTNFFHCYRIQKVLIALHDRDRYIIRLKKSGTYVDTGPK
jgi:hypothetical protein